jgi:response regulator RpfG family c-di-GMP phosphodiesterase
MNILVLDKDFRFVRAVRATAEAAFEGVEVYSAPSWDAMVRDFREQWTERHSQLREELALAAGAEGAVESAAHSTDDIVSEISDTQELSILIRADSQELIEVLPPIGESFMGYRTKKFQREPLFWKTLVTFRDRSRFNRAVHVSKAPHVDTFVLLDAKQREFKASVEIVAAAKPGDSEPVLKVSFKANLIQVESDADANSHAAGARPTIDLIIVSFDMLSEIPGGSAAERVKELSSRAIQANALPVASPVPVMLAAHDHVDVNTLDLIRSGAIDLIFKPLDELFFLQKLMIVSPEKLTPLGDTEFLFTLEANLAMELGQDYKLQGMCEYGVRIFNRVALAKSAKVKAVSPAFGDAYKQGVYLCVDTSEKTESGMNATELTFFGMTPTQFRTYKQSADLQRQSPLAQPKTAKKAEREKEVEKEKELQKEKPKPMPRAGERDVIRVSGKLTAPQAKAPVAKAPVKRKILMIDLDDAAIDLVRGATENQFTEHELVTFDSFEKALFAIDPASAMMAKGPDAINYDPRPAFFPNAPIKMRFNPENLEFMGFSDFPVDKGVICGYVAADLILKNDFWRDLVHVTDRPFFKDFLFYVASGQSAKRKFNLINKQDAVHVVNAFGQVKTVGDETFLELELTDITKIVLDTGSHGGNVRDPRKFDDVDLVLLDHSFIRQAPAEGVARLLKALRSQKPQANPGILLTGKEIPLEAIKPFTLPEVTDLLVKPVDRQLMLNRIGRGLPAEMNKRMPETFVFDMHWMDILKPITVKAIGEYGVELHHGQRIPTGAWGHFYHPELLDNEGRGLLGICFANESLGNKTFANRFLFFGIRDSRLKQLRVFLKKSILKS